MRTEKAIGVALSGLVVAGLAMLWQDSPVAAAGQQAASQNQQAEKPKTEKQVVTVHKQGGGEPMVVTVESQDGQNARVITRTIQAEPMIAALAAGPRLGIQIRNVGKDDVAKFKLPALNGVVIEEVTKDSAAEKAGLKAGDVVVQFDGENVRSAAQLTRLVRESVAGRPVKMGVIRDGKRMDVEAAPAEAENEMFRAVPDGNFTWEERAPAPGQPMPPGGMMRWRQGMPMPVPRGDAMEFFGDGAGNFVFSTGRGRLGVNVQELTPELAAYFGVKDGLLVNSVEADTPAAKAGLKAGDVIGSVNGKAVVTTNELIKELADKEGEVTVGVTRDKKPLSLKATLEPRKTPARRTPVVGRPA
jgi:serine protease Do